MKIIKVVHANTEEDLSNEGTSFVIHDYDIEAFLQRQKEHHEAYPKRILTFLISSAISSAVPLISLLQFVSGTVNTSQLVVFTKEFARETVKYLLKDIVDQIEKIEVISLDQARTKYPKTRNLSIGTYTLHPRDSQRLTRLDYYHKNLALEKDDELIVLLGRMGAKSLKIIESDISEGLSSTQSEVDVVKVDAKVGVNLSNKVGKGKELLVEFEGNVVDIDRNLLDQSLWFSDDSKLLSIFESRRFDRNRIEQYTLSSTYTETFDFNFDLAVKYLVVKTDLKAEYKSISKKERLFQIEFGKKQN